jgi:hypothetical protein
MLQMILRKIIDLCHKGIDQNTSPLPLDDFVAFTGQGDYNEVDEEVIGPSGITQESLP